MKSIGSVIILLFLVACASKPAFKLDSIDYELQPGNAAQSTSAKGHLVLWGGIILNSTNFKDHTRLEILAYPVDNEGRIDTDSEPSGRFYALAPGYLETAKYSKNRWLSLTGTFIGMEPGNVGGAEYNFPVIESTQLHLWEQESLKRNNPQIHFGIGVQFH